MKHDTALTRFGQSKSEAAMILAEDHPAVIEGRPLFLKSANEHKRHKARVLVSGHNSRKVGKAVSKGKLAGFPIYTLTLEERATCPRSCTMWRSCYGNRSPWSLRWPAGADTEQRIERELSDLQFQHPGGFLVRLHALGDFYSVAYVDLWSAWLDKFPALHCYGYTARQGEIGEAVAAIAKHRWWRFAIRSSDGVMPEMPASRVIERGASTPPGSVVCPVETGKSTACATCALCWDQPAKTIIFLPH